MKYQNDRNMQSAVAALAVSFAALPAFAADENPFQAHEIERNASVQKQPLQGMCGGCWEGRCGGMMGGAMTPGLDPAQLPEPSATGARLLTQYCTQCHGLPNPKQHSAEGWPMTVERMQTRMVWMSRNSAMGIKAPTEGELKALLGYLQEHAANVANLGSGPETN